MYAVIETGGQQHRVAPGDLVRVQLLDAEKSAEISLGKVLLVAKDDTVVVGSPFVDKASVTAVVQGDIKARKVLVYKQRPRKGFRKLNGHRQPYTVVKIKDIVFGG